MAAKEKIKSGLYLVVVNLLITIALVFSLEGVTRLFSTDEPDPIFQDEDLRVRDRPFIERHPIRGFSLKASFANEIYVINSKGFRGAEFPENLPSKFLILTLGESTTFGWGVRNGQDYPSYLMTLFQKNDQDVYVINGGVPSYSSSQVLLYLQEILNKIKPDLILVSIMWNDIWYSTLLHWYPDVLVYQKPGDWELYLLKHSHLVRKLWLNKSFDQKNETDKFNGKALSKYRDNIKEMILLCKKHQVSLALIEPPFDVNHFPDEGLNEFQVRYSKAFFMDTARQYLQAMKSIAEEYNILVMSHRLALDKLNQDAFFLDPLHPTSEGNFLMAQDIYDQLKYIYDQ